MEHLLAQEGRRADAYKILAECYCPPDEELLRMLHGLAGQAQAALGQVAREAAAVDNIEDLKIDHARLFVGPFQLLAPPFGSVYLESNALMGESTADVVNCYRREGMEAAETQVPDHITAELEFMYVLIRKETEAMGDGDIHTASQFRRKQKAFLDIHLGAWVVRFAKKVLQGAQTEFYRTLGRVTDRFVRGDLEQFSTGNPTLSAGLSRPACAS